jgi:acyl-coenzyme A thioesterase PaaI-like protein
MGLPYIVTPDYDFSHFTKILPKFPNWEKSFVSGKESPLFQLEHFIHSERPTLVLTTVKFLAHALGPPGNVHGGATAALADEVMGISVWHHGDKCVTQALELRYGRMLPLADEATVFTEVVLDEGKTLEVYSTIYGKSKTPHVSARGVFHRLSAEQLAQLKGIV